MAMHQNPFWFFFWSYFGWAVSSDPVTTTCAWSSFVNNPSYKLGVQTHPTTRAKIVIGTEADWPPHNQITNGKLHGFDIDLIAAVCNKLPNTDCAVVTAPWQSVWPSHFYQFGVTENKQVYAGQGFANSWYQCSVGTRNTINRQQSALFTDSYTDPRLDSLGFVVANTVASFPANGKGLKVGVLKSQAFTDYFLKNWNGWSIAGVTQFDTPQLLWRALTDSTIDSVYTGHPEAQAWIAINGAFKWELTKAPPFQLGVAFACRPEYGDIVTLLNKGIRDLKNDIIAWSDLCAKWPGVACDHSCGTCAGKLNRQVNDVQCQGLQLQSGVKSAGECESYCCKTTSCNVWQFCPGGLDCGADVACYAGPMVMPECQTPKVGWVGKSGNNTLDACPAGGSMFSNTASITTEASKRADIIFGTEADWGQYNYINHTSGLLEGFDVELVKGICASMTPPKTCAVVTTPWQSIWPKKFPEFSATGNPRVYPGWGTQSTWFHCSTGTRNTDTRQRSTAFSNAYTNIEADKVGFVVPRLLKTSFPATAANQNISVLMAQAFSQEILTNSGPGKTFSPQTIHQFDLPGLLWDSLTSGKVQAVFTGRAEFNNWLAKQSDKTAYEFIHGEIRGSRGVSFGCRPEFGGVVAQINVGLANFKAKPEWKTLCDKYSGVDCAPTITEFKNAGPTSQVHPTTRAEIVFGTEADWGKFNFINSTTKLLDGFDVELMHEICRVSKKTCAIVTMPWQSAWPKSLPQFGVASNTKTYPGWGTDDSWFHCTSGTRNTIERQRSTAFSASYTDDAKDKVGFVVRVGGTFPPNGDGKKVGVLNAQSFTGWFLAQTTLLTNPWVNGGTVVKKDFASDLWSSLKDSTVDAVFTGEAEFDAWKDTLPLADRGKYEIVQSAIRNSKGVAFGCRPEYGDAVKVINDALTKIRNTTFWTDLCDKYKIGVTCNKNNVDFVNQAPATPHPYAKADIVIGTEADWGNHNNVAANGSLVGFDIEFTHMLCAQAKKTCAIVTVPWQSVWPKQFPEFKLTSNVKSYPGWGTGSSWFHCSTGTRNTLERQQSTAFTYSYTDKTVDRGGFISKISTKLPANGKNKKVRVLAGQAFTNYFLQNSVIFGVLPDPNMAQDTMSALVSQLETSVIDAIYTGSQESKVFMETHATGYEFTADPQSFSEGVAYGCRPEYGGIVSTLNKAIQVVTKTKAYQDLCAKHKIDCGCISKGGGGVPKIPTIVTTPQPTVGTDSAHGFPIMPILAGFLVSSFLLFV